MVWESVDTLEGSIGEDSDILYARSVDQGSTWSPPAALNDSAASDDISDAEPAIASDGSTTWLAVWVTADPFGPGDINYARSIDGGLSWSPMIRLNVMSESGNHPTVAGDPSGTWIVAWSSFDFDPDREIIVTRSMDGGLSWEPPFSTTPEPVLNPDDSTTVISEILPDIATDGMGTWMVARQTFERFLNLPEPTPIATGGGPELGISSSMDSGMSWEIPARIVPTLPEWPVLDVGIEANRRGDWIAVWIAQFVTEPPSPPDWRIRAARSADLGASWSLSDVIEFKYPFAFRDPRISLDDDGRAIVVLPFGGAAYSGDRGANWSPLPSPRIDDSPDVSTDGNGHWLIVWSELNGSGMTPRDFDIMISIGDVPEAAKSHWMHYE